MGYTFYCPTRFIVSENAGEDLVKEIGTSQEVLIITDKGIIQAGIADPIVQKVQQAGHQVTVFSDVPGNPGVEDVRNALAAVKGKQISQVVAIGGGSAIDTAKAVGILLVHAGIDWEDLQWGRAQISNGSIPVTALPTTAGTGSEMTHVAVIGDSKGFKKGVVNNAVFSKAAIIDGGLMKSLPANLTAATGMDALVHAIEAYLGKRANPMTDLYALAALKDVTRWLPEAVAHGDNLQARRTMAVAAAWGGIAMDQAGLGLVHALAGPLCAHYHAHHGLGVAVLLPATLEFDAPDITKERWQPLREALNMPSSAKPEDLKEWAQKFLAGIGMPTGISGVGVDRSKISMMSEEATRMAMIGNNIRAANAEDCAKVLEAAL